jgi:hypothetical protein
MVSSSHGHGSQLGQFAGGVAVEADGNARPDGGIMRGMAGLVQEVTMSSCRPTEFMKMNEAASSSMP